MPQEVFDFVIPLFRVRWNTRAVIEGISTHYQPRAIHIIAPGVEVHKLQQVSHNWHTSPLYLHQEENFFNDRLTKEKICAELDLEESLYTPGWFYQQLLKLGAFEGIDNLSEWYVVWDSDLLPVDSWCLVTEEEIKHSFALLQHNGWGNNSIVAKWEKWINCVLGVKAIKDPEGTFVPHHMWFKQEHLRSFASRISDYYRSPDHWLLLMMRSANEFGTFSEYWSYVSWVAAKAPQDLSYYPYREYGSTSERFFDDGTGLFSVALKQHGELSSFESDGDVSRRYRFGLTYADIYSFIEAEYGADALPSSLSFESSPRHLQKEAKNMHIEELRSRWNPREVKA